MLFIKNSKQILLLAMILVFCTTTDSYAFVVNAYSWQSFADKIIYFLGSDRCPMPGWLRRQRQMVTAFAEPNSRQSILAVESFLEQALEGYEQDSFAWHGRIPVNKNPSCILGLYLAERFPGTKLGDLGRRLFDQSVEHSCLVAFGTEALWKQRLETGLMKVDKNSSDGVKLDFLDAAEWPLLLIYFAANGTSEEVQQRARKLLADHLWQQYGLAPALVQYRLLLLGGEYSGVKDNRQLEVAELFEQTGAISDAEELYGKILKNTNLASVAITAAENLARIKLANSQEADAWKVFSVLHGRFSEAGASADDLKSFFVNFQANREKKFKQLIGELSTAQKDEEVLKLCRALAGLLTEEEATNRWQHVIDNTEPESLAWHFSRLYLAQSLVNKERVNEAKDILSSLSNSSYAAIRARALFISADIAQQMDRTSDAVNLYYQAAKIERPTALPQWFKVFHVKQMDVAKLTAADQGFFASFLRGYNELIDGDFGASAADLLKAREVINRPPQKSLAYGVKKAIPSMLMLAYLKMSDYSKAGQYGLQAIRILQEDGQGSKQLPNFISQIEKVDDSLFVLSGKLWSLQKVGSKSELARYASNVNTAVTVQGSLDMELGPAKSSLMQLFWQIKRQRVARLLSAEYHVARARLSEPASFKEFLDLEPVIFIAQLLGGDSFEQISRGLAAATPKEYAEGQMYRFARFAQQNKRPYMARMALNVAAQQIDTVLGNVQSLENIADIYLEGNSHHKAIEIYERIVEQVSDSNDAEKAQLKIIKVYAEQLKLYDKAIRECQEFLKKFAGSRQVNQVEFLIGKLAYLAKDYAGAVGQLDIFRRKYQDAPQVGLAMMLAALSRMSEGNTQDAIDRFTEIIQKYPEDDLAARSKFLIGYAQVSDQKYSQALETFRQLVEQFPKSKYTGQAHSFIDRLSKVVE